MLESRILNIPRDGEGAGDSEESSGCDIRGWDINGDGSVFGSDIGGSNILVRPFERWRLYKRSDN